MYISFVNVFYVNIFRVNGIAFNRSVIVQDCSHFLMTENVGTTHCKY